MKEFPLKCQVCTIELTYHGEVMGSFLAKEEEIPLISGILYLPLSKNSKTLPYYIVRLFEPDDIGDYVIIHQDNLIRIDETNWVITQ